jgi:large subunit ribosomal protein L30
MSDATKRIRVTRTGSPIGRRADQLATLIALGLKRGNASKEWRATPEVLGRVRKVKHLVRIEEVE